MSNETNPLDRDSRVGSATVHGHGAARATGPLGTVTGARSIHSFPIRWFEFVLLGFVALFVFVELRTPLNVYDEGLVLSAGRRLLAGDVPYLDFWRVYPPGSFFLAAVIEFLGGVTLVHHRLVDTALRALTIVVLWLVARRIMGPLQRSILLVGAGAAFAAVNSHYLYPVYPAFLLVLVAIWCALRAAERVAPRPGWNHWFGGLALALAASFRLDVAGYGLVALILVALLGRRQDETRPLAHALLVVAFTSMAIGFILATGLCIWAGAAALWDCLVAFPAFSLRAVRGLPLPLPWQVSLVPTSSWVAVYSLAVSLPIALIASIVERRRDASYSTEALVRGLLLLFACGLVLLAASRPDRSHALPSSLLAMVVLLALWSVREARSMVRFACATGALGLAVVQVLVVVRTVIPELVESPPWGACRSVVARAGCVDLEADQVAAIEYLRSITTADERIYVGNSRHDMVFIGDTSFYYLAERLPATRYDELHPGVVDQPVTQLEMVEEMRDVRHVVIWDAPNPSEPNLSSVSTGVTTLDDYIRGRFRVDRVFGTYQILVRER